MYIYKHIYVEHIFYIYLCVEKVVSHSTFFSMIFGLIMPEEILLQSYVILGMSKFQDCLCPTKWVSKCTWLHLHVIRT